jgi:hypothetical protein
MPEVLGIMPRNLLKLGLWLTVMTYKGLKHIKLP